jgi:hypothetical protein
VRGIPETCGPGVYPRLHGRLYRNLSGTRFRDETRAAGVFTSGNSLGVACADFTGSGRVGLAVANDELSGDLILPTGRGRFRNIGNQSGTALSREGHSHAGMGIDWGDYDNDGRPDLFVATYAQEARCLYHNEGHGQFCERSAAAGIEAPLLPFVSFGCRFLDADNDGWLDLLIASGHVWDNPEPVTSAMTYRQPVRLLRKGGASSSGRPDVAFSDATPGSGIDRLPPSPVAASPPAIGTTPGGSTP